MTKKFDLARLIATKSIRKEMPKPTSRIPTKKDKDARKDLKKGRKNWIHNESTKETEI
jgi:hypothetical protein